MLDATRDWSLTCTACGARAAGVDRFDERYRYCHPGHGGCGRRVLVDDRARRLAQIFSRRKIDRLVHVTRSSNLPSLLRHGLVPRDRHQALGIEAEVVDSYRYDGDGHTNLSLTSANRFMSVERVMAEPDAWVVLCIAPSAILTIPTSVFHQTNAANANHRHGSGPDDLEQLFVPAVEYTTAAGVFRQILRGSNWPDNRPTDAQAEITVPDVIPARFLDSIWTPSDRARASVVRLPGADRVKVAVHPISEWWAPA